MNRGVIAEMERRTGCVISPGARAGLHQVRCPSQAAKVSLLDVSAWKDARYDERIRAVAAQIAQGLADPSPRYLAPAIHAYVRDRVRFVGEGIETFQDSWETLRTRMGDCDDHARLVLALARAVGIPGHLETLNRADGVPRHAVARLDDGTGPQWAETSVRAEWGEHPSAALRRLKGSGAVGASARADIGDLGDLGELDGSADASALLAAAQVLQDPAILAVLSAPSQVNAGTVIAALEAATGMKLKDMVKEAITAAATQIASEIVVDVAGMVPFLGQVVAAGVAIANALSGGVAPQSVEACEKWLAKYKLPTGTGSLLGGPLFTPSDIFAKSVAIGGTFKGQVMIQTKLGPKLGWATFSRQPQRPGLAQALLFLTEGAWRDPMDELRGDSFVGVPKAYDTPEKRDALWQGQYDKLVHAYRAIRALQNPKTAAAEIVKHGVPAARRAQFRALRRAIEAANVRNLPKGGASDGGAALWTAYLDLLLDSVRAGHIDWTSAPWLLTHYHDTDGDIAKLYLIGDLNGSAACTAAIVGQAKLLVDQWRQTIQPAYAQGQAALAELREQAEKAQKTAADRARAKAGGSRGVVLAASSTRDPWARAVLLEAWGDVVGAPPPTLAAVQAVQAVGRLEGFYGFGWKGPMVGSNNWGAIQLALEGPAGCPSGSSPNSDTNPNQTTYRACFRRYATPRAGAAALLRELVRRPGVLRALDSGSATDIAAAMFASKYFTGVCLKSDPGGMSCGPEPRIGRYALGIENNARDIAKALNERHAVTRGGSVVPWIVGLGALGGAGYATWRFWPAITKAFTRSKSKRARQRRGSP